MKNIVILLTGTIDSSGVQFMKRNRTEDRLLDYLNAINKWLKLSQLNIVFVENSNYPQNEVKPFLIENSNFEYLTYDGQGFSREKGKGFGEINSFDYAFKHSNYLKNADYVVKCNGRYYFESINKLISYLNNHDFDVIGNFQHNLSFVDSRVFAFKPTFFYKYFLNYKNTIDDSKNVLFEHVLAFAIHKLLSEGGKWIRMPVPLIIDGISGTGNFKYHKGLRKYFVKGKFHLVEIMHHYKII